MPAPGQIPPQCGQITNTVTDRRGGGMGGTTEKTTGQTLEGHVTTTHWELQIIQQTITSNQINLNLQAGTNRKWNKVKPENHQIETSWLMTGVGARRPRNTVSQLSTERKIYYDIGIRNLVYGFFIRFSIEPWNIFFNILKRTCCFFLWLVPEWVTDGCWSIG